MRCRACNSEMEPAFWLPEGASEAILETCCPFCLFIVRAMEYDGGPENELDVIAETIGHGFRQNPPE